MTTLLINLKQWSNLFSIKYVSLILVVLQNTLVVTLLSYSRSIKGPMYSSGSAVTLCEVVKLLSCCAVIIYQKGSVMGLLSEIKEEIINQPRELANLAIPSFTYTVQNNLLYFALSNLDAATFQVGFQIKLLTTAVFSVILLGRSLSTMQWFSLVMLTVGVIIAQLATQEDSSKNSTNNSNLLKRNSLLGFAAVLTAACLSGFASNYFEKILKNSHTSLWIRNIQMSLSAIIISLFCIRINGNDWKIVSNYGFFHGYNTIVFSVIFVQAMGGLLVAVVIKYADNILKGFATSFCIVTSGVFSMMFLDFHPNQGFITGASFVMYSLYLYNNNPLSSPLPPPPQQLKQPSEQGLTIASKNENDSDGKNSETFVSFKQFE